MQTVRRSRRSALRVNSEINLTNLIDVAFVLLIVFMITAPIMQGGIEVQLPEAQATPLTSSEALNISVDQNNQLYYEETPITLAEFGPMVASHMERRPDDFVSIKVDARARFELFPQLLGILKELGVENVSVPVEPVAQRRR
jgi:biopolymer transport protein TolR